VWANDVLIAFSQHEFTLDFLRIDYASGSPPRRGVVAARVANLTGLRPDVDLGAREAKWQAYAAGQIPPEVSDGDL
jgi:hypothetical protein